jgi:hypothetical protein
MPKGFRWSVKAKANCASILSRLRHLETMPLVEEQFEQLKTTFPQASLAPLPSGAFLVTIPDFQLPDSGWSTPTTTIRFLVPVGYPQAKPDTFWASSGLRLISGALPHASGDPNAIPETAYSGLWFSWHTASWNPNRDTLQTYVKVILDRFRQAQ